MSRLKVVVLGEKPQGVSWLKMILASGKFDVVAGVPRRKFDNAWWGADEFEGVLLAHQIPVVNRAELARFDYDIIWSLMYGFVIEPELISKARYCGLNLHEAPLPRYRGCNGYAHAIHDGDPTYGTSLHLLGAQLDSGDLVDQEIFPIGPDMTVRELYVHTMHVSDLLHRRNLERVAARQIVARPLDLTGENTRPRSSLTGMKEMAGSGPLGGFRRAVRALDFVPFEPAYFRSGDQKWFAFINNSLGRYNHAPDARLGEDADVGALRGVPGSAATVGVGDGARCMILMRAEKYRAAYPVFQPAYSWAPPAPGAVSK